MTDVVARLTQVAKAVVPPDFQERRGYPPGVNRVAPASNAQIPDHAPGDVARFFAAVQAVDLPDLWNGYFIALGPQDVKRILLDGVERPLLIVASNGGGVLYGVPLDPVGPVLVLPHSLVRNGVYHPNEWSRPVAATFDEFLAVLADAALNGEPDPFDAYR